MKGLLRGSLVQSSVSSQKKVKRHVHKREKERMKRERERENEERERENEEREQCKDTRYIRNMREETKRDGKEKRMIRRVEERM
jgi:hypothetical protein